MIALSAFELKFPDPQPSPIERVYFILILDFIFSGKNFSFRWAK
jgi:hypothetical protein